MAFFFFFLTHERKQCSLKLKFEHINEASAKELAVLLESLDKVHSESQRLTNKEYDVNELPELLINRVSLNSPLEISLLIQGIGAAWVLVQSIDKVLSWKKDPKIQKQIDLANKELELKCKKLELENKKLESAIISSTPENIEPLIEPLNSSRFKLKGLEVEIHDE